MVMGGGWGRSWDLSLGRVEIIGRWVGGVTGVLHTLENLITPPRERNAIPHAVAMGVHCCPRGELNLMGTMKK